MFVFILHMTTADIWRLLTCYIPESFRGFHKIMEHTMAMIYNWLQGEQIHEIFKSRTARGGGGTLPLNAIIYTKKCSM